MCLSTGHIIVLTVFSCKFFSVIFIRIFFIITTHNTTSCFRNYLFLKYCVVLCVVIIEKVLIGILMGVLLQALLGHLVFGEVTSLFWWGGAMLVLLGLMLICKPHKQHDQ